MTKRAMSDALNGSFLERLNGEYQHVRDNHVGRLLAAAGGVGDPAYLDAALQFGAHEMPQVLFQLAFAPDAPSVDRARAAVLYLHGAKEGWWKVSADNAERARGLIAAHYGDALEKPEGKTEPKPAKSRVRRNRVGQDEIERHLAIMRECSALNMVLRDPAATAAAKLDAIKKWFQALGWLAPDELRAAVATAMEKIHDRA